jgi:16S rRNA (cytosine967-C5)-methyltransferase
VCGRVAWAVALADAVGPTGHVSAIEIHEARVEQIAPAFARLGLKTSLSAETVDLSVGTGGLEADFDHVLVDAPCSGLGTVHRRPEILLRLSADDLPELVELQRAITRNASRLVKPGGTLTYAVCSFAKDEGVSAMSPLEDELKTAGFESVALPGSDDDGWLRLGPWCDTDGYQVRQWKRRA